MNTYYNEIDANTCLWLRELIKAGAISEGDVDERSIEDVSPDDLRRYRRCHFFSGIGVWDHALQLAGFPAGRNVWTASCPCTPFSAAGKRKGFADERHLWPAFFYLVTQCRPGLLFGEQVASDDGLAWLDLVYSDLEAVGYTVGALVAPAAGFGAPHGRHRIYWVAKLAHGVCQRGVAEQQLELCECGAGVGQSGSTLKLAVGDGQLGGQGRAVGGGSDPRGDAESRSGSGCGCESVELVNPVGGGIRGGGHGSASGTASGVQGADGKRERVRIDARSASRTPVFRFDDERCYEDLDKLIEQGRAPANIKEIGAIIDAAREFCRLSGVGQWANPGQVECGAECLSEASEEEPQKRNEEAVQHQRRGSIGVGHVADTNGGIASNGSVQRGGKHGQRAEDGGTGRSRVVGVAHDAGSQGRGVRPDGSAGECAAGAPSAVNGFWGNAEWLPCTDGKQRAVEPGLEPMVDGLAGDLGLVRLASYPDRPNEECLVYAPLIKKGKTRAIRLRGYGNAIVAPQAAAFIKAFLEAEAAGEARIFFP